MTSAAHSFDIRDFSGIAPLFPLPDLVLFPHILQPLHLFEPRYLKMLADALAGERLIAMALLQPGWEPDYFGRPALHSMVCLGRITAAERLPSGRYNIMLQGLERAHLVAETGGDLPYRVARLELGPDRSEALTPAAAAALRSRLLAALRSAYPQAAAESQLHQIFAGEISLGMLCDMLVHALKREPEFAQQVLAELDVARRCELVLAELQRLAARAASGPSARRYPPTFSTN